MAGMHSPVRHPAGRSSDFIMHVYSCDHWIVKGSVSHVQSGRSLVFQSMMELILAIQAKLDEIGSPQSATAPRHWSGARPVLASRFREPPTADSLQGDTMPEAILASFLVRIQFRQNASWQGTLVWVESKESCAFRSLLELITLIAPALNSGPAQEMDAEESLIAQTQTVNGNVFQIE